MSASQHNGQGRASFTFLINVALPPYTVSILDVLFDFKIKRNGGEINFSEGIETKDVYNNVTIIVNRDALLYKGKSYSINDVAFRWKKDCRMWLWKNSCEMRKNKSVGDQIKAQLIKQ